MRKLIIILILIMVTYTVKSITPLGKRDNDRPLAHALILDDEFIKAYKEADRSYIIIDGKMYVYDMVAEKFYERK